MISREFIRNITVPLEASEIEVEDPSLDQTAQDSNSEPHMIIPIASGSRQGPLKQMDGIALNGPGLW